LASVHSIIEGDEGFGSNKFVQESSEKKLAEYTQSLGDEGNEFKSITDSELRNSWIGMLTSIAGEIDDGSFSVPLSNSREEALLQDVRNNRKKK
jgi:hypothetical protein